MKRTNSILLSAARQVCDVTAQESTPNGLLLHLRSPATHCNNLQHTASHLNTLHTATHCNTGQLTASHRNAAARCNTLQHAATNFHTFNTSHHSCARSDTLPTPTAVQARATTLHHNVPRCNTLQHTTTHCITLQHTTHHTHTYIHSDALLMWTAATGRCTTLHHTSTHCNTLQHTATHCKTLLTIYIYIYPQRHAADADGREGSVRAVISIHPIFKVCNALPEEITISLLAANVEDRNETALVSTKARSGGTLQHVATLCNTLQHTATHCNTLQHTATHCNTLPHKRCLRSSSS